MKKAQTTAERHLEAEAQKRLPALRHGRDAATCRQVDRVALEEWRRRNANFNKPRSIDHLYFTPIMALNNRGWY